jgi:hypothetical protein
MIILITSAKLDPHLPVATTQHPHGPHNQPLPTLLRNWFFSSCWHLCQHIHYNIANWNFRGNFFFKKISRKFSRCCSKLPRGKNKAREKKKRFHTTRISTLGLHAEIQLSNQLILVALLLPMPPSGHFREFFSIKQITNLSTKFQETGYTVSHVTVGMCSTGFCINTYFFL